MIRLGNICLQFEEPIDAMERLAGTNNVNSKGTAMRLWRWSRKMLCQFRWESLVQDVRIGARMLRKSPGFAITAVLTLSLGIAATVAIFGFVDSALIRPLPYPDPSRLAGVFETTQRGSQYSGYSYPNYVDMARANRVFSTVAAYYTDASFVLSGARGAQLVNGTGVTSEFFRILGVTPILGVDFEPSPVSEDLLTAPSTVILSNAAWQNWFGGRADAIGKTITLNEESYMVIGVLPSTFQFAPAGAIDFWTTLRPLSHDSCSRSRGCLALGVIARLKDSVTVQQALDDVRAIAAQEAHEHPDPDRNRGGNVALLSRFILGDIQPILLALLAGAGLLLLIAYINVTGLLLVRSENRRREFAVRSVLGASRAQLAQQFVVEGLLVATLSSALGLIAATFTRQLLLKLISADMLNSMPYLSGSGWNWHVAVFAATLVLIALILFAATPPLRLPFANLRSGLATGAPGTAEASWKQLGTKLVVLELATTMVLLAGAGLLGKSLYELLHVNMGFVPSHLATLSMLAPEAKYENDGQALALQREVLSHLRSLPGVTAAGTARSLPVSGVPSTQIGFVGKPNLNETNEVGHQVISTDYLAVLKAQLLQGRYFDEHDNLNTPSVAIINETLAREYFPDENPLGKQIFYHQHGSAPQTSGSQHPLEIVGVIADIKEYPLDADETPVVYSAFDQGPARYFYIAVRTSQEAAAVLPSLVAAIHEVDSEIVIDSASTMPEIIQDSSAAYLHRATASLAGGFAIAALMLSTVGLYGVIAYSVSRRTFEIGVRMALGATRSSVYSLILREACRLTFIGLVIGFSGAVVAGIFMRSLLFGVRSWDVSILSGVAAVVILSTVIAVMIPARRASRVDPMVALRHE
jgi:macrolide transport system ATP-binding/permease protein